MEPSVRARSGSPRPSAPQDPRSDPPVSGARAAARPRSGSLSRPQQCGLRRIRLLPEPRLWPPQGAPGSCAPPPRPSAARPVGGCFSPELAREPAASREAGSEAGAPCRAGH